MKRSLWLKLMVAFIAVILLGSAIDAWLTSRVTQTQFSRYVSASGQAWTQHLAPNLAAYYSQTGSWSGVETLLQNPWQFSVGNNGMTLAPGESAGMDNWGMGMDNEMEQNHNWDMENEQMPMQQMNNAWEMMGFRLLLADSGGTVVADTAGTSAGIQLTASDLAAGTPVLVGNSRVGTLLAVSTDLNASSPAGAFVNQVNQATWLAGLAASLAALALGSLLFRQIVSPVQRLTSAAQRVAAGDLEQRIEVKSQDEIGQLATAFNQMADSLARDQELRRNLMADVAHELRTPLSIIQGNLEAMLDGVLPASPEEIASLRDETALLARLVSDLRLLSLAEAGQLKLERVPTDLPALIRNVLATLRPQAEAENILLADDLPASMPSFNLDPDRISQALHNLLANALRYTPAGGTVTVGVRLEGNLARVNISDTGSGIAPDDLPHLFDRFYRAEKSRSRASGGSGIGLTIVRQLVRAHGGEISVESPILKRPDGSGYGSRFTFTLPPE